MKKTPLFLASSKELRSERERFELEIYRKCKAWFERGISLHLDIWEDLSARMATGGSQSEYNKKVRAAEQEKSASGCRGAKLSFSGPPPWPCNHSSCGWFKLSDNFELSDNCRLPANEICTFL